MNPNNITSQYYNFVTSPLKGKEITDEEISLINNLVPNGSKILDVGAGTGRHSLILNSLGFNVTAIDSSSSMLDELKRKDKHNQISTINKSIFQFEEGYKFDLIIMFWNTFNEIALTKTMATRLLKKLGSFISSTGKILINIDDSAIVDPSKFSFSTEYIEKDYLYKMKWDTHKYNSNTNTSISKENVEIYKNNKLIDNKVTYIKQRYWSVDQVEEIAKKCKLSVVQLKLKTSNELYLILSPLNK